MQIAIYLNSVTAHLYLKTHWKNNAFYSMCMWKCVFKLVYVDIFYMKLIIQKLYRIVVVSMATAVAMALV